MRLLTERRRLGLSATQCYFKGVKLFNASYSVRDGAITLQPSEGVITPCDDLLVEVAVIE